MKIISSVIVICEDEDTRGDAVRFCDNLVSRFWATCEFEINWLLFNDLEDRASSQAALAKAVPANLVIFAMRPGGEIPLAVRAWIELWLAQRGVREGAIVGLDDSANTPVGAVSGSFGLLRGIAHRAGMDYLTELPETVSHAIPITLESCSARAHQVTSVLDQILHQKSPPHTFRL